MCMANKQWKDVWYQGNSTSTHTEMPLQNHGAGDRAYPYVTGISPRVPFDFSRAFTPRGGGGSLWSQTLMVLPGQSHFLLCNLGSATWPPWAYFPHRKRVKHDSLPGSLWTPSELQGGGAPESTQHTGSMFSVWASWFPWRLAGTVLSFPQILLQSLVTPPWFLPHALSSQKVMSSLLFCKTGVWLQLKYEMLLLFTSHCTYTTYPSIFQRLMSTSLQDSTWLV